MIVIENIVINGANYTRTYSDTFKIRKVGTSEIYADAIDPVNSGRVYEETDTLLEIKPPTEDDMKEALSIMGVQT